MRRRRSLGGGFSPRSLFAGGVVGVWYDPSDVTTLFQDTAGTTPVTASGDPVGKILDKSGNGNHLIAANNSTSRPIYTVSGSLSYIAFDGSNDSFSTNSIDFTGSNKMSVATGVTKSSDTTVAIISELSATYSSNVGSFYIAAPETTGASGDFSINARGTFTALPVKSGTILSPATRVLTALFNISSPSRTLRLNGTQIATSSASIGTGNFGNYQLFIGRRNNASFPFNGNIYGYIQCGKEFSASELSAVEKWLAQKTGVTL